MIWNPIFKCKVVAVFPAKKKKKRVYELHQSQGGWLNWAFLEPQRISSDGSVGYMWNEQLKIELGRAAQARSPKQERCAMLRNLKGI